MAQNTLLTKNKTFVFWVVASAAGLAAMYALVYLPKARQINELSLSLKPVHQQIFEYQAMARRVPNPDAAIEQLQNRVQRLKQQASSREEVPKIIQSLAQQTEMFDIEVVSMQPRESMPGTEDVLPEGVRKVYIEVALRCPYEILGRYLESLASLEMLFTIEDLVITKNPGEMFEDLEVGLVVSTYILA